MLMLERHAHESWQGPGRGFTKVEDEVVIYRLALVAGVRGIRVGEVTYTIIEQPE